MSALGSKTESALAAYLGNLGTIIAGISPGESSLDKTGPFVICIAHQGEEEPFASFNFWVDFEIALRSPFGGDDATPSVDPKTAHDADAQRIFDAMSADNLDALLSAALAGFTCQGHEQFRIEEGASEDAWFTSIKGRLYCCNSTLSP